MDLKIKTELSYRLINKEVYGEPMKYEINLKLEERRKNQIEEIYEQYR